MTAHRYHIEQGMRAALKTTGRDIPVVSLVTQMVVSEDDPGFRNPTKPIGPFYTRDEAEAIAKQQGYAVKEDAGRGWRSVVPSPIPKKIVEIDTVKRLWDSTILITAGGGGIPVVGKEDGTLEGVEAVIDKDYAAELLAEQVGAGMMKDLSVLQEPPFTDKGSVVEVFTDLSVWMGIRNVIEQINSNAAA